MFRTQNKTLIEVHGRSQGKSCIGLHSLAIAPLKFSLPVAAFADSVTDYATFGTTSAGTATWSGIPVTAGGTISVTSALFAINNVSQPAGGTISLTTGTLTAVTGGFTFTGGMIDITNSSSSTTLFQGSFTSGSVMVLNG